MMVLSNLGVRIDNLEGRNWRRTSGRSENHVWVLRRGGDRSDPSLVGFERTEETKRLHVADAVGEVGAFWIPVLGDTTDGPQLSL